jgi:hypothetical protein
MRTATSASRARLAALVVLTGAAACGPSRPALRSAADLPQGSPLGPSYVLLPLPGEDEALLGRVVPAAPEPGRSLEEISRPNPCADKLGPTRTTPLASTFEDVQELAVGAKARATLGMFGFEGDVERATHFVYRLETTKRVARTDTNEYVACCKEQSCGYGYVSALVYGDGEYATGSDERVAGGVSTAVAGASGGTSLQILHKRRIRGWMTAVVTVTAEGETAARLGPLGAVAGLAEESVSDAVKARYEPEKIRLELTRGPDGSQVWMLVDGHGPLSENELARRFRGLTGSGDLDDVDVRRNTGALVASGLLFGGSAAALV